MDDLTSKFATLEKALRGELIERNGDIEAMLRGLVAGSTVFFVGEPGIAKSLLVRRLHAYIGGAQFFDLDLDKYSVPEDLFGPLSLSALKDDRWERQIDGTIITADFAFLDEIFEASSALLKALLRTLNERTFKHGTTIIPMRLTTLFAASNLIPTEPRLLPLFDRFIIRRQLQRIQGSGNFLQMLETTRVEQPDPILDWDDVLLAQLRASRLPIDGRLLVALTDIRRKLEEHDIRPSDRRFYEALKVIRATAWLSGATHVEADHLRCLQDILWTAPDQAALVSSVVNEVVSPLANQIEDLLAGLRELRVQVMRPTSTERERRELGNELHEKTTRADNELAALEAQEHSPRLREQLDQARELLREVTYQLAINLYDVTPASLPR